MACHLHQQTQYLTRQATQGRATCTFRFKCSSNVIRQHHISLAAAVKQLDKDVSWLVRCNAAGGLQATRSPDVPNTFEELQQLSFPSTLRDAWNLLLEVLWARGHFSEEHDDKDEAFEDITAVKHAVLDAARQRADIMFTLPKEALTQLAQVPLPPTPRSDERKLRNAYKRLVDSYAHVSAAPQQPAASVQDVLRVIWSWEDAMSMPQQSKLEAVAEVESAAVQLLQRVLQGLFSAPDAAHQAAAEKLGTITMTQVKQLQQYQAARAARPPWQGQAGPFPTRSRSRDTHQDRRGGRSEGRDQRDAREGRWQSFGNAAQPQHRQVDRPDRHQQSDDHAWFGDDDSSPQPARHVNREARPQTVEQDQQVDADQASSRFHVERFGSSSQRNHQQTRPYGNKSAGLEGDRTAPDNMPPRGRYGARSGARQRPWLNRKGDAESENGHSPAGQDDSTRQASGRQADRYRQARPNQQPPLRRQQRAGVDDRKGMSQGTSGATNTSDQPDSASGTAGWQSSWQE